MPAYLVYICQGVSDRKELETYWKDMPPTFIGFDVKLHTVYRPFELLEGEGPVEGVVKPAELLDRVGDSCSDRGGIRAVSLNGNSATADILNRSRCLARCHLS